MNSLNILSGTLITCMFFISPKLGWQHPERWEIIFFSEFPEGTGYINGLYVILANLTILE